jgi:putative N6-adenine-specific DNA methylase
VHSCFAVVAPGIEEITANELRGLGVEPEGTEPGGVSFRATPADVFRLNLQLRTASRLLLRLGSFHARSFPELERHARALRWHDVLREGDQIAFRVTSRKSKLYHQDGIGERLARAATSSVEGVTAVRWPPDDTPAAANVQRLIVRVFRDEVTVSADASGELLHRRGYRQVTGKAPLRETLAAAMLIGAGWTGDRPLVDPFAGSGTIPIEAAMLARRIPPGLARSFACERWPLLAGAGIEAIRNELSSQVRPMSPVPIRAFDRDAGAIAACRANAERAGVLGDLDIAQQPISALELGEVPGALITNPPYGRRIGEAMRLRDLYARLGQLLRRDGAGWMVGVLVAHPQFERQLGLPLEQRFSTVTGAVRIRFLAALLS